MKIRTNGAAMMAVMFARLLSNFTWILSLGVFMILAMSPSVEAQGLLWAKRAGGTGSDAGLATALDGFGNSYVAGVLQGSATFGLGEANETTLTSAGSDDIFVAKYDSSGALLWAKRAGGTGLDRGLGIAVDGVGNSYLTGLFAGSATFGLGEANETTLTSAGSNDIVVAKYDSSGALLWAKRAGGAGTNRGAGIALDLSGNNYVTGSFDGSATFGLGEANQTTLVSAGDDDIFVAKYDSNGAFLWAKRAGYTGRDNGAGIAVDGSGYVHMTGHFEGWTTFGLGEANETTLTSAGERDIFVVKFDSNGTLLWAKRAGEAGQDRGFGIAEDGLGNSYVTGLFNGSATFGLGEANQTILISAGGDDIFVAKFGSNGALLWARRAGGTGSDAGMGIAVDGLENAYVTGFFNGITHPGSVTFGSGQANETTLVSAGDRDIFVAKYDSIGEFLWARRHGGTGTDQGMGIAVDGLGIAYVTGFFGDNVVGGSATFGLGESNETTLVSAGGADIFIAKVAGYKTATDFDGDGKGDIAVYQASTGNWFYVGSMLGFGQHLNFGGANFLPVPGDYDGDGVTDTAVYDTATGNWFIAQSTAGFRIHPSFGGAGFIPVPGDYDSDGKMDVAVYQTSTGHWFIVRSTLGFTNHLAFGGSGFVPVPGDYDGDGQTDTAVYQTSTGHWFIAQSTAGFRINANFGGSGFVPVLPQVTILRALGLL